MSERWCIPSNLTLESAVYAPLMAADMDCESTHETPRTRPPEVSTPAPSLDARVPAWNTFTLAVGAALATASSRPVIERPLGYESG
jgi:hypothetical protein